MKKNIKKVPYNKDHPEKDRCVWWTWDETCDRCGEVIHTFGNMITTEKPEKDKDYCLKCLRHMIDNKIKF